MADYIQPDNLKGITLIEAYIKDDKHFAFVGQRFKSEDAWEHVLTYAIFYFADKPESERWLVHELDYMTDSGGVKGVWCEKPKPHWLFGYVNTGYMLSFNEEGHQINTEIIPKQNYKGDVLKASFNAITAVREGNVYAARGLRTVWRRSNKNQWQWLDVGIPLLSYYDDDSEDSELMYVHGFSAISGFSDNDLYACGGNGDLWHYNGEMWQQKELPTNASLNKICCGEDGWVYILTNMRTVVVGRNNQWKVIKQDLTDDVLEHAVWYQDCCIINTGTHLYEIRDDKFIESPLLEGIPNMPSHIDARGDILLTTAKYFSEQNEVSFYDGEKWNKVLYRERPPKDPDEPSLLDIMKQMEKDIKG